MPPPPAATANDIPSPKFSVRGYPTLYFVTAKGEGAHRPGRACGESRWRPRAQHCAASSAPAAPPACRSRPCLHLSPPDRRRPAPALPPPPPIPCPPAVLQYSGGRTKEELIKYVGEKRASTAGAAGTAATPTPAPAPAADGDKKDEL